jgi:hypothetical protein
MAIDNKLLAEIKNKVQPGKHVKYMDKNNLLDAKTVNDPDNTLEKAIKAKEFHKILEALYHQNNSNYVAAPKKGKKDQFTVIDSKNTKNPSFEVTMSVVDNSLVIENLMDKKQTTIFEMGSVLDSTRDTPTTEDQVDSLMENLKKYKNKTPKELKQYLLKIVKTL